MILSERQCREVIGDIEDDNKVPESQEKKKDQSNDKYLGVT